MTHPYARYLYPVDADRPRAGTLIARLRSALANADLVQRTTDFTCSSVVLVPAGHLADFCRRAHLFRPRLHLTLHGGDGQVYVDPWRRDAAPAFVCPRCDAGRRDADASSDGLPGGCHRCALPFDPYTWPVSLTPEVFRARVVVALVADDHVDGDATFGRHLPQLPGLVAGCLGEPVLESLIAAPIARRTGRARRRPTDRDRAHWAMRGGVEW